MSENIFEHFVNYFTALSDQEKFTLGKNFHEKTGGRLSAWSNPIPVVVALIPIYQDAQLKLLGIRRGINPFIGGLALPGGFQDNMESAVEATAREVLEETGLETNPGKYEIFGNPCMTPHNNQLIFFKYKEHFMPDIMDKMVLNSEVIGFEIIDKNSSLCFPTHNLKAQEFFNLI